MTCPLLIDHLLSLLLLERKEESLSADRDASDDMVWTGSIRQHGKEHSLSIGKKVSRSHTFQI